LAAYSALHLTASSIGSRSQQPLQFNQVPDADEGPPSPKDNLWVQPSKIRPLPGQNADARVIDP